jgi:hypothetical protein
MANVVNVNADRQGTFFLPWYRFWELGIGAVLAYLNLSFNSKSIKNFLSSAGFVTILIGFFLINEYSLFPGWFALLPTLGCSLIILAGDSAYLNKNFLSQKFFVAIGLISFPLYLWHWPLLTFIRVYLKGSVFILVGEIVACVLSILIAYLTYRFLEKPIRKSYSNIGKVTLSLLLLMLIVGSVGVMILSYGWGPKIEIKNWGNDKMWRYATRDSEVLESLSSGSYPPIIGKPDVNPSFAVWGDSIALSMKEAIELQAKKYNRAGYLISHSGTLPLLGIAQKNINKFNSAKYNEEVINFISRNKNITTVIICGWWNREDELTDELKEFDKSHFNSPLIKVGIIRTVDRLLDLGINVVFVHMVGELKEKPEVLLRSNQKLTDNESFRSIAITHDEYRLRNERILEISDEIKKSKKIMVIHPERYLFDSQGISIISHDGNIHYLDKIHLTTAGSSFISKSFEKVFK